MGAARWPGLGAAGEEREGAGCPVRRAPGSGNGGGQLRLRAGAGAPGAPVAERRRSSSGRHRPLHPTDLEREGPRPPCPPRPLEEGFPPHAVQRRP